MLVRTRRWVGLLYERLREWSATREAKPFLIVLALGAAIRIPFLPSRGFFGDLQVYIYWGDHLTHHFLDFYSTMGGVNYPPLTCYLYGLIVSSYEVVARVAGTPASLAVGQSLLLTVWAKLPALLAELTTFCMIYAVARRRVGTRGALVAAASYALSPVILVDGTMWGQTDAIFVLVLIVALMCCAQGRGLVVGLLLGVAVMLKPQPLVFVPLFLVYLFRWFGWRKALLSAGSMCATALVIALPYLLPPEPQMLAFVQNMQSSLDRHPYASISGLNLWWFLGIPFRNYQESFAGPLSVNMAGDILFGITFLIALGGIWLDRSLGRLFAAAALVATAFFVVTTMQHERYLYPAVPFFLLAALHMPRYMTYYVVATISTTLNLMASVVLTWHGSRSGLNAGQWAQWLSAHSSYLVAVAGLNVWLWLSASRLYFSDLDLSDLRHALGHRIVKPEPVMAKAVEAVRRPSRHL